MGQLAVQDFQHLATRRYSNAAFFNSENTRLAMSRRGAIVALTQLT